jgi:ribosomal-protein-alanine N-acetyltransferase
MPAPSPVELRTKRLLITMPPAEAAERFVAYTVANREHHAPWTPGPARPETIRGWRERLARYRREAREDVSLRLFLFRRSDPDGPVLGGIGFTSIERGPLQSCRLGYALDRDAVGHGYMVEALRAAIPHVFDVMRLHRITATYMPSNVRSAAVLKRLGFTVEGVARDYLFVGGAWHDHVVTSLSNPRWRS